MLRKMVVCRKHRLFDQAGMRRVMRRSALVFFCLANMNQFTRQALRLRRGSAFIGILGGSSGLLSEAWESTRDSIGLLFC